MPLFGSQYVQHAGKPLDPAHHRDWFRNRITTIGEVWHSAYGVVVPAPLLIRPCAAKLRQCIPADWLRTLHQGKSDATAGDWVLVQRRDYPHQPEHSATGQAHPIHGYLAHVTEATRQTVVAELYLLTCNGWVFAKESCVYDHGELTAATVEPYPAMHNKRDQPATIQLVGPTSTCWSSSVGRLYQENQDNALWIIVQVEACSCSFLFTFHSDSIMEALCLGF